MIRRNLRQQVCDIKEIIDLKGLIMLQGLFFEEFGGVLVKRKYRIGGYIENVLVRKRLEKIIYL